MNPPVTNSIESSTVEEGVNALMDDVKHKIQDSYQQSKNSVQRSPGKAILIALASGYCLHRLPVKSLLVAQVRLITALAPPVIFAFGAVKLCDYLQRHARR